MESIYLCWGASHLHVSIRLTSEKLKRETHDEAHIYNSHFRLRLSKAFKTWTPSARNPTNSTRSKSMERTSNVASNGIIVWPSKCVRVEDLMGSGVPTI